MLVLAIFFTFSPDCTIIFFFTFIYPFQSEIQLNIFNTATLNSLLVEKKIVRNFFYVNNLHLFQLKIMSIKLQVSPSIDNWAFVVHVIESHTVYHIDYNNTNEWNKKLILHSFWLRWMFVYVLRQNIDACTHENAMDVSNYTYICSRWIKNRRIKIKLGERMELSSRVNSNLHLSF